MVAFSILNVAIVRIENVELLWERKVLKIFLSEKSLSKMTDFSELEMVQVGMKTLLFSFTQL